MYDVFIATPRKKKVDTNLHLPWLSCHWCGSECATQHWELSPPLPGVSWGSHLLPRAAWRCSSCSHSVGVGMAVGATSWRGGGERDGSERLWVMQHCHIWIFRMKKKESFAPYLSRFGFFRGDFWWGLWCPGGGLWWGSRLWRRLLCIVLRAGNLGLTFCPIFATFETNPSPQDSL